MQHEPQDASNDPLEQSTEPLNSCLSLQGCNQENVKLIWEYFLLDQVFSLESMIQLQSLLTPSLGIFENNAHIGKEQGVKFIKEKFEAWVPKFGNLNEFDHAGANLQFNSKPFYFSLGSLKHLSKVQEKAKVDTLVKKAHSCSSKYSDYEILHWMLILDKLPSKDLLQACISSKVIEFDDWKNANLESHMLKKLKRFHAIITELSTHDDSNTIASPSDDDHELVYPIIHGRISQKAHRDILLDEMSWMAVDFSEERALKKRIAYILATEASDWVLSKMKSHAAIPEIGIFCNKAVSEDIPIFGPPDAKDLSIPLPPTPNTQSSIFISVNNSSLKTHISSLKDTDIGQDLSLFVGPFAPSKFEPINNADYSLSMIDCLNHNLESSLEQTRSANVSLNCSASPPWSILEDQIILETCLQFNLNCHVNCSHKLPASQNPSMIVQHELIPPCNLVAEFLNSNCHHNSFVRTPLSVLQRFHHLVQLGQKHNSERPKDAEIKPKCSRKTLLELYRNAIMSHKSIKNLASLNGLKSSFTPSWKIKQWEKRMFIFGLIKKKVHTRGGSILSKEHFRPTSTLPDKKVTKTAAALTATTSLSSPTSTGKNVSLPYNLYLSAVTAHPSHESAVKKATVGIPKHLISLTTSATDLALKRLQRVFHQHTQPTIGPVIISPIGGGFTGSVHSASSQKKSPYPDQPQSQSPTYGSGMGQSFSRTTGSYPTNIPRSSSPTSNRMIPTIPPAQPTIQRQHQYLSQPPPSSGIIWHPSSTVMPMNPSNWNQSMYQSGQFPISQQTLPNSQQIPIQFQPKMFSQPTQFIQPSMGQSFHPQQQAPQFYPLQTQQHSNSFHQIQMQPQLTALTHSMPQPPQHLANMSQSINSSQMNMNSQGSTNSNQISSSSPNLGMSFQQKNTGSYMSNNLPSTSIQQPGNSPSLTGALRPPPVSPLLGIGQFNAPLAQQHSHLVAQSRLGIPVVTASGLHQMQHQIMPMMMSASPTSFGISSTQPSQLSPGKIASSITSHLQPNIHQNTLDLTHPSSIGLGLGLLDSNPTSLEGTSIQLDPKFVE